MLRRVRSVAPYFLAFVLAWLGHFVGLLGAIPARLLSESAAPLYLARMATLGWAVLSNAIPLSLGCWIVWRLAVRKNSPYRWGAVVIAGLTWAAGLSFLVSAYAFKGALSIVLDVGIAAHAFLLPWALSMLTVAVAVEPWVSAPLGRVFRLRALAFAAAVTALGVASLYLPAASAWIAIAVLPAKLLGFVAFGTALGTANLMVLAGARFENAFAIANMAWTAVVWYLIARSFLAWRASRTANPTTTASA